MIDASDTDRPTYPDGALAAFLAASAGDVLLGLRREVDERRRPADEAELRRAGDRAAQAHLARLLAEHRPTDHVLSEEAVDDGARLRAERVWIVDPLDGTREFAERRDDGSWRDDFAVHVALWQRGRGLTDGAVALPARGCVYASTPPPSAGDPCLDDVLAGRRPLRLAASRTRPPAIVRALADRGEVELVPMGSCGAKSIAVLEGLADAYVHAEGQYEWDSAAPVAVVVAAGLVATRLDGSALEYNRPDPRLPDLVICHPAIERDLRRLLDGVAAEPSA
jgi:3'(2'), 5'-bisphosphate nucleotidase